MFERIKAWWNGTKIIKLPKNYKFIIVTVGNENYPATMQQIDDWAKEIEWHVKHKSKVVSVPYWVELTVMK